MDAAPKIKKNKNGKPVDIFHRSLWESRHIFQGSIADKILAMLDIFGRYG